jgi:uncharacterized membrane protein YeaQ/YmgE (transglycosylase-associated protein family)
MNWSTILSNKYFTTIEAAVAAFVVTFSYNWVQSGEPWPLNWHSLLTGVVGAVILAVYNLYKQPPAAK